MNLFFKHRTYFLTLLIYLSLVLLIFNYFKYYLGQDVIQYLSISHQYISGHFGNAINGVWGPLISWLLIPLLLSNIPDIFSFKILQILIGAILLIGVIKISLTLLKSEKDISNNIFLLFAGIIIILCYYIFFIGTPDLLMATCIFYYFYTILSDKYFTNKYFGIISGVLGALAYFSKAYALPFFIIHFTILNIYYLLKYPEKRGILKLNFVKGLTIFIVISSVWIILLSNKYGHFTYSTAGSYNFSISGPEYKGLHTFRIDKLYPPLNPNSTSYWEDPTFLPVKKWNILNSWSDFQYFLNVFGQNIKKEIFYLLIFSPLFLFLFVLKLRQLLKDKTLKILLASAFLYLIGYLPLFLEERFLIIPQIILILITFSFLNNVTNNYLRKGSYRWILLIIFFISITYKPIYSFYNNVNADKEYFVLADDLKDLHVNGNFAGLSTKPLSRDWGATLFLAYELNSKFYGEINSKFCSDSIYYNLKKNNIKYLFVWDKNKIISHPAINEIYVKNIKTYDNDNFVLNNKFVNKFYSLFNLNVTQKENKYLKLYKLN